MANIYEALTDDEIRQELIKRGLSLGPITPTTKKIYLKKLQQQPLSEVAHEQPEVLNFDDEDNEDVQNGHSNGSNGAHIDASGDHASPDLTYEDSSIIYPKLTGNDLVDLRMTHYSLQQPRTEENDDDDHVESSRVLTPEEIRQRRQYISLMINRRTANKKKESFISYVCVFAFGAVLAVLFANMFIFPFFEKNDKSAIHDEI